MVNYQKIYSSERPQDIEMTETMVFVAKNIKEYSKIIDDHEVAGYEYDYSVYTKDEYIQHVLEQSNRLEEELAATKILLGVD